MQHRKLLPRTQNPLQSRGRPLGRLISGGPKGPPLQKPLFSLASTLFLSGILLAILFGKVSFAQEVPASLVIGTPGRTGCLVCHSDPRIRSAKTLKSLYIDETVLLNSAHKDTPCTKCHTDFATRSHTDIVTDWKKIAGVACKNCHQHADQLKVYSRSVHGRLALGGSPKRGATCADCHGAHDIGSFKKSKEYKAKYHVSGDEVCGRCHRDFYQSYNDYYHGKAYKMKAADAPACWDCHGTHEIMPSRDATSPVSKTKLAKTCGKCHTGSGKGLLEYAPLIHGKSKVIAENPIFSYKDKALTWVNRTIDNVKNLYQSLTSNISR